METRDPRPRWFRQLGGPVRSLVALALLAGPALASSEEAWEAFRADVLAKCRVLVPQADRVTVEVNPFGSDRFGVALVTLQAQGGVERMVCIYDKQAQTAELTTPFD